MNISETYLGVAAGMEFYLIDFGLACDSIEWQSHQWKSPSSHVAGNAKYWAPCSWVMLCRGWQHLNTADYTDTVDQESPETQQGSSPSRGAVVFPPKLAD